jgi:hypothetical protein
MRKNIPYLLAIFSILLLIACGSNSKKDPIKSTTTTVDGYYFSETEDSLVVDSYKTYTIKFKLNKDDFALPSATVKFKSFDSKYGTVTPSTVTTDENGNGKFIYRAPTNMPATGTTFVLQYVYEATLENASVQNVTQNVTLNFNFDPNKSANGRATTLSISYLTTTCDKRGIIEHYNVHAADPYSREPIVGMDVEFSLINGVTVLNGRKVQRGSGTISNGSPITFKDNKANFSTNVTAADNLIIMPTEGNSEISYMGGWSIDSASKELQLNGTYNNIQTTNNLTYIIGNEQRLLGGKDGTIGIETVAHVQAVDATTDSSGFAYFDIVLDPALGGHTVVVEAHGDENGKRFGISKKEFLRASDFIATPVVISNTGGEGNVAMSPTIVPGCVGKQHLREVPTYNYKIEPSDHCFIDYSQSDTYANSNGIVSIYVITDGNTTAAKDCTLTWKGGAGSLSAEY